MKVTVTPIVLNVLGIVTQGLIKGLENLEKRKKGRPCKLQYYKDGPEY